LAEDKVADSVLNFQEFSGIFLIINYILSDAMDLYSGQFFISGSIPLSFNTRKAVSLADK
jgi:hypothetical protein